MRSGKQRIRHTIAGCALGRLLVAASERGICALYLGDSDAELAGALRRDFPAAILERDDAGLAPWAGTIRRHLAGEPARLDLPLDLHGTPFQQRVWAGLRQIPAGHTLSYGELARRLGLPHTATRAVAAACGANRVAILVPCHRVVGADGRLTGYRWGLDRKHRLLELERSAVGPGDVEDTDIGP
jgi:AraC family transcriptional regulator of adaptative response/methylated-DNA-[protein]-cysteine methyltransferase